MVSSILYITIGIGFAQNHNYMIRIGFESFAAVTTLSVGSPMSPSRATLLTNGF